MFSWFKDMFDMGDAAYKKEIAELHNPGHAEVKKWEPPKKVYSFSERAEDYAFGTFSEPYYNKDRFFP